MSKIHEYLNTAYLSAKDIEDDGLVATYIPELGKVSPDKFGVHLSSISGIECGKGDFQEKFSIQSIAKVLSLTMAYNIVGEEIWARMDVEPSGSKYNSLIQLELENGIPRNPLLNAGAIVVSDILVSRLKDPLKDFLAFVREAAGNMNIQYSEKIAASEKSTGFTNAALINLMKSFKNIENDADEVLNFYFHLCSLEMTCEELSKTFLYLVNDGIHPLSRIRVTSKSHSKRINAIMQLCGFYDEAGEFAFRIGLPGKSGVGGGIIAVNPDKYSVAVWSPRLNPKGNSVKGMVFLETFTNFSDSSIF